jgi:hydrogenase maturation protein HypF
MAQNCLKNQKVIGVAFDGTGLGSDDTLWGGEFLLADYRGFRRLARLKEVALIGGEMAIKEPWRVAAAWLYQLYGDNFLKLKVPFVRGLDRDKWRLIQKMYLRRINSPLSSSMGRLFDAAAALILNRPKAEFAAQLPMELEELASHYPLPVSPYAFRIVREKNGYIIDPLPVFRGIVRDLKKDLPRQEIAAKFHLAVAGMITRMCLILSRQARLNKVVLGGGVFQNKLLLGETKELLCKNGLRVFAPEELGADDSVISLGQAVIAAAAT